MTDTQSVNNPADYCLQQAAYARAREHTFYDHGPFGHARHIALPCMGITPSHMPRNTLSTNPVEIESALFGINSVNLVDPQAPVRPELHHIPEVSFFERLAVLLPRPLVIERDQRPFPVPE
jgi:hypothetical protein